MPPPVVAAAVAVVLLLLPLAAAAVPPPPACFDVLIDPYFPPLRSGESLQSYLFPDDIDDKIINYLDI